MFEIDIDNKDEDLIEVNFPNDPLALLIQSDSLHTDMVLQNYINQVISKNKLTDPYTRWDNSSWERDIHDKVHNRLSVESITRAKTILNYFSSKFVTLRLHNHELSSYKKRVCQIASNFSNGDYRITRNDIGLLFTLPYFYDYDCYKDNVLDGRTYLTESFGKSDVTVTMHSYMPINHAKNKKVAFYMITDNNEVLICNIEAHCPLLPTMKFFTDSNMRFVIRPMIFETLGGPGPFPYGSLKQFDVVKIL